MGSYLLWLIAGVILVLQPGPSTQDDLLCDYEKPAVPQTWIKMTDPCLKAVIEMIRLKMSNAVQFLALGAHFRRDSVNRPGISDVFMDYADSDRDEAIDLIDYLVMRGKFTTGVTDLLASRYPPTEVEWDSVTEALNFVLNFQAKTTERYRNTIATCENQQFDDFHIGNWLSQYFLGQQYENQEYFAKLSSELTKMNRLHLGLGEFFLDTSLSDDYDDEC